MLTLEHNLLCPPINPSKGTEGICKAYLEATPEIKAELKTYLIECIALGMSPTKANILTATYFKQSGYSPNALVRFFGIGVGPEPPPEAATHHNKPAYKTTSVDKYIFMQTITAFASIPNLTIDQGDKSCIRFNQLDGTPIAALLQVNGTQDRILFEAIS